MTAEIAGEGRVAPVEFRAATADDLASIEGLLSSNHLPTVGVREALPDFIIAQRGSEVVGAVGLELFGDLALLRSAVVSASLRGIGLGAGLVDAIIETANGKHVRGLYLLTTTAESFFPRFGFERISRDEVPESVRESVEFRGACPASATVMRRVLSAPHDG